MNLPTPGEYINNAGPQLQNILRRSMWGFMKMDNISVKDSNTVQQHSNYNENTDTVPNTQVRIRHFSSNYPSNYVTVIDLFRLEVVAFNSPQSVIDKYTRYFGEYSPNNFMRYDVIYNNRFISVTININRK